LAISPTNANRLVQFAQLGNGSVDKILWYPDGKTVALASTRGVFLLDSTDFRTLQFTETSVPMKQFIFLPSQPDGRLLAAGESNGVVEVWDVKAARRILSLNASGEIRLSPDGNRIAISNEENYTIDIYDVNTGKRVTTLKEFMGEDFTFSLDSSLLAAGLSAGTVRLLDVNTGAAVRVLTDATSSIVAVSFSPNREMLAASESDGMVWVWDTWSGVLVRTIHGSKSRDETNPVPVSVSALTFSPDSRILALGSTEGLVRLVDVASGDLIRDFEGQINPIRQIVFHPTGSLVLTLDQDGMIKEWKTSTGTLLHSLLDFGNRFQGIQFQNDGELATWRGSLLWNIDPANGQLLRNIDIKVANIKASSHAGYLLAAADQKEMQLWNSSSLKLVADLGGKPEHLQGKYGGFFLPYGFFFATFSSDDQVLAAAGSGGVRLWDVPQTRLMLQTSPLSMSGIVAISPNKRFIGSSYLDPYSIAMWDYIILKEMANDRSYFYLDRDDSSDINQLTFSPDGRWVAATSDSALRIWDIKNQQLLRKIDVVSSGNLAGLAFSPDQKMIAVGGPDGHTYLYDIDTFRPITVLSGHKGSVALLAFSIDGRFLASASEDGILKVWGIR
jgi:WD40 repeat protein